ncbi:hypothetical protein [Paraburkholderia youngii]|uniref:hypothetical protein n=1 Tax=Paraburkholderia youngii TaxID=2782701 RepID=UPI003D25D7B5
MNQKLTAVAILAASTVSIADKPLLLEPSGRFITDNRGRKVAEMMQPGDSPAEQEAIKRRIVGSFNALPDLVSVLLRADRDGALWKALDDEGIKDSFGPAFTDAVAALGDEALAEVAHRFDLDLQAVRAKVAAIGGRSGDCVAQQ